MLQDYVNGMACLNVDQHEYGYLKLLILFSPGKFSNILYVSKVMFTHFEIKVTVNSLINSTLDWFLMVYVVTLFLAVYVVCAELH